MNSELRKALDALGTWTECLTLEHAAMRKQSRTAQVVFTSGEQITPAQEASLQTRMGELLAPFAVELQVICRPDQNRQTEPIPTEPPKASAPVSMSKSAQKQAPAAPQPAVKKERVEVLLGKEIKKNDLTPMDEIGEESGRVVVEGVLISLERKDLNGKGDKTLLLFAVTDYTSSVQCKLFLDKKQAEKLNAKLEKALGGDELLRIRGDCSPDMYSREKEICLFPLDIQSRPKPKRMDNEPEKRVELHLHTKMSAMDGLTSVKDAIKRAAKWGHKAIAVTDHGVIQAFPEAAKAAKDAGIKLLFGVEGYLLPDAELISRRDNAYVVFDLETTGLKPTQASILEIGAVKIVNDTIVDRFSTFVDPGVTVPPNIVKLTGITQEMVDGAPAVGEALRQFAAFAEGCVLVAHNADFDVGFIRLHGERYDLAFENPYLDTLMLARYLIRDVENYKLNTLCDFFQITLENHHRAVDDAEATAYLFEKLLTMTDQLHAESLPAVIHPEKRGKGKAKFKTNHIIIFAKNQAGMKNLYTLVTHAHLNHFRNGRPQIPRSLLTLYRDGLILGTACEQGELYQAILKGTEESELLRIASMYDFMEIQPDGNNAFMVRQGIVPNEQALHEINRHIIALGDQLGKPTAATGDVHFLNPEDALFRAVIMHEMGFKDAVLQAPLYLRTTEEMLSEFSYLGDELARRVVIQDPNRIADQCEPLKPYPDGTYPPVWENAADILKDMAVTRAKELYGDPMHEEVQKRLDKELNSIITNGFSSLYLMAQRLVKKSLDDGYLVGSRGSVGSSLVATMAGITEVNPLAAHYVCPNCKHADFDVDPNRYSCGVDLPDKNCPVCGHAYNKAGYNIPFEVFLGFKGDKTPDIDLNFSGEYQPVAHKYVEVMFGTNHAFRAGTISVVKEKTAYGYVRKFLESQGKRVCRAEIDRLCKGCEGVKRTTGQHPGGIVIVPKEREIEDFTPVQFPADRQDSHNTITTHFDFHALDDRLVKLDILGHDDPTVLRMLHDITGLDPRTIPLDDPETMKIYSSLDSLKIDLSELQCDVGALGIPEFGTEFVRGMLQETRPTTMDELVRLAGLSHGTDVWLNNARDLVVGGIATLPEVICTRDDIMNYLIAHGCEPLLSFKTMESVRKGKGLKPEMEEMMEQNHIPEWFVSSCKKIKYMFPRAHAAAYVMMSFRIAYYKVHLPKAYYATYFTVRGANVFDVEQCLGGAQQVIRNIREIRKKDKLNEASVKEKELLTVLEVVYEMNLRGIELLPVDLYRSDATKFRVEEGGIRPPFSAIEGLGQNAAQMISADAEHPFVSVEDFQHRTNCNSAVLSALERMGCFRNIPKTNQISLF